MLFQAFSWYIDDQHNTLTVHVIGKTKDGRSICTNVSGFQPSICIGFSDHFDENDYDVLFDMICTKMKLYSTDGTFEVLDDFGDHLIKPDDYVIERKPMWGFTHDKHRYMKFNFQSLLAYNHVVKFLKSVHRVRLSRESIERFCEIYESFASRQERNEFLNDFSTDKKISSSILKWYVKLYNASLLKFAKIELFEIIDPLLKFAHGKNLKMAGWMEIEKWNECERISTCAIEISTNYKYISSIECDEICHNIKEMAFDIESYSHDDMFPNPEHPDNYVYQIGITLKKYSENEITRLLLHFKTPERLRSTVTTTGECLPIKDTIVENFDSEKDLLLRFADVIFHEDPDIIYGYNSDIFDWSYLMKRSKITGCIETFSKKLSRFKDYECKLEEATFSSSAYGDNRYLRVNVPGRLIIDLMIWIQRNMPGDRYPNYKLDTVAEIEVKEKKRDVKPKEIFKAFRSGDQNKCTVIGDYCCQDTILVQKLVIKLDVVTQMFEMANITDTPPMYLLHKGQQIKVFSQISKKAEQKGYVIPYIYEKSIEGFKGAIVLDVKTGRYDTPVSVLDFASLYPSIMMAYKICYSTIVMDENLERRLIEMKTNGEKLMIDDVVFDFIEWTDEMLKYNESGGFKLFRNIDDVKEQADRNDEFAYRIHEKWKKKDILQSIERKDGIWTVEQHYRIYFYAQNTDSIIPDLQMDLKRSRKAVKKMMAPFEHSKNQEDQLRYRVLNGRQLAIKVSMNSIYGFTSAFMLNLPALSASVTAKGRQMIEQTKDFMEQRFERIAFESKWNHEDVDICLTETGGEVSSDDPKAVIRKFPAAVEHQKWTSKPLSIQVVGGDTDSVFCNFPNSTLQEAISLCHKAEEIITAMVFNRFPIEIEYEKTYCPMVYQKKKSYVGKKFEMDDQRWKIDYKGIAVKRRNYCPFVKDVFWSIIYPSINVEKLDTGEMISTNVNGADLAVFVLQKALSDIENVKFEKFIISASLKSSYKNDNLPHVQMVKRMKERDEGSEPRTGERFGYVVIDDPKRGVELTERTEDPSYALEHGMKIDYIYYLKQQLEKPITTYMILLGKEKETNILFENTEKRLYDLALKQRKTIENRKKRTFFDDVKNHVKNQPVSKLKPMKKRKTTDNNARKITDFFQKKEQF